MDITALEYFRAIAQSGSLTKAARQLHITQPAMSAMLRKLEDELGAPLFDRTPNRIYLNKAGKIALIHVNTILRNVEQMKDDVLSAAQRSRSLCVSFCDPGVRWFTAPRFSIAYPEIQLKDDLYGGDDAARLLSERVYDLMVTPQRVRDARVQSVPFLRDQVYLSVPQSSNLAQKSKISIREIPAQPLLYPQIGGYFLAQLEKVITEEHLSLTLVKNNYNVTQHLIRTTNFLATISTLSMDLRNDGTHRRLIPLVDPELEVLYYISYLKSNREKVKAFLQWAGAQKGAE